MVSINEPAVVLPPYEPIKFPGIINHTLQSVKFTKLFIYHLHEDQTFHNHNSTTCISRNIRLTKFHISSLEIIPPKLCRLPALQLVVTLLFIHWNMASSNKRDPWTTLGNVCTEIPLLSLTVGVPSGWRNRFQTLRLIEDVLYVRKNQLRQQKLGWSFNLSVWAYCQ
jgi:hypothetical protein